MKKWHGLLLTGLMGCAGRPQMGYCPNVSHQVAAVTTTSSLHIPTAEPLSAPLPTSPPLPRPPVSPPAETRVRRMTPPPFPSVAVRALGRHLAHTRRAVAHAPTNHAVDGLGKLLLVAAIVAGVVLATVIFAFTAPATVLGAVGKVVLWGLGGVLLVTLLNGLEGAIFPDRTRK